MLLAIAAMTLTQIWVSRVDNEFTDFDLVGDSLAFGTYSSFGVLDLKTGHRRWASSLKGDQLGTRVAMDGKTFVVSIGNGPISAYDAMTGKPIWTIAHAGYASPIRVHEGILYAETKPNFMGAFSLTGSQRVWSMTADQSVKATDAQVSTDPVLMDDSLLLGLRSGTVNCLNAKTGEIRWIAQLSDSPIQAVLFDSERVYAASARGVLYGIGRETGTVVWHHDLQNAIAGSPLLQDGRLAIVSSGGYVVWLAAINGSELWRRSFSKDEDFSVTGPIAQGTGILFMRRSGAYLLDDVGRDRDMFTFSSPASARAPIPYKGDYILFDSHAVFRARPQ